MANEMDNARALRAAENYEKFKETSAPLKYFVQFGGKPSIEETGYSPEQYQKFIDALTYGQSTQKSFSQELEEGLSAIEGIDANATIDKDSGTSLIELSRSKKE